MGGLDAEDQAQLADWSRQQEAELAAILSPAELQERFYRESEAARYVRQSLPGAQSETKFRLMVKLAALAESVGLGADDAQQLFNRLLELQPELDQQMTELEQSLTGTPEAKQKRMQEAARAVMEAIAIETLGEKGRALVDKLGDR